MTKMLPTKRCLAAALVAAGGSCWAALGDPSASVANGAGVSSARVQTAAGASYTQLTRRLESGTEVREYADAGGTVFAVSWSGPFLPDLRALLGPHFAALEQHSAVAGRSSAVSISRPDVAIISAGRMGAFQGRAWLPRQLPAGLDPRTLQ
ncbi:DUF2844 domain-containing protein [Ramlibacter henchirensis]|uniref:DUF2844 domain-containing protein n=1 Tax=Ramlibacter henchirensis TaxID=204072 RepID=A0A4Z0BR60_9BURK|nr:DUF2844 domain-containing protein [Ramlibacter henchirensis]TFZ00505.1 DUF2844 domain-containing protein [Ramlibacter henchirensis]